VPAAEVSVGSRVESARGDRVRSAALPHAPTPPASICQYVTDNADDTTSFDYAHGSCRHFTPTTPRHFSLFAMPGEMPLLSFSHISFAPFDYAARPRRHFRYAYDTPIPAASRRPSPCAAQNQPPVYAVNAVVVGEATHVTVKSVMRQCQHAIMP